jgi:Mlc titration factor MtfA (ptsG expression regulator)
MESGSSVGWLPFLVAFPLLIGYLLVQLWKHRRIRRPRRLHPKHRGTLARYAIHYQRLDDGEKRRFERLVAAFVHEKEWRGAGIAVAEEMKVMIGACAAQLLLGFPEDLVLKHFGTIVVFPESYRSATSGRLHQGEVRPQSGVIIISWQDFLHGYAHTRDAHNVGLHEMAHALWFENKVRNGEHDFLHPELLQDWIDHADAEIERIRNGKSRLLRSYAGINQAEFFAVAVEYFFERPTDFKADLPELYATLSTMLRQDPASV